jgi:hypothetical protein
MSRPAAARGLCLPWTREKSTVRGALPLKGVRLRLVRRTPFETQAQADSEIEQQPVGFNADDVVATQSQSVFHEAEVGDFPGRKLSHCPPEASTWTALRPVLRT